MRVDRQVDAAAVGKTCKEDAMRNNTNARSLRPIHATNRELGAADAATKG